MEVYNRALLEMPDRNRIVFKTSISLLLLIVLCENLEGI